ncbi:hypothetical protein [Fibrobacter succinogenes]|uniref:hypothetical protein n=1 Tax=Fibrobacter succinogenes TaxID=833 RepID=UPI0015651208|nr:hypothetical protein [Fibrobacter succinogenes]
MKRLAFLVSLAALLCSCAGVNIKQPGIDSVKKIAVVTVSGSEDYENIEVREGKKEKLLTIVSNAIKEKVDVVNDPEIEIVTHGANALAKTLNGINGWSVIPFDQVTNNEDVRAFFEDRETWSKVNAAFNRFGSGDGQRLVSPDGMYPLPYDRVAPRGMMYVNGERIEAPVLRGLGKLCESLGVDAVAVAEYFFYYETGMMTGVTRNVTPIVFVNVALIDKNGEKVLYTDNGWARIEGDYNAKVYGGYASLKEEQSVKAYKHAIDQIMEEFSKEAKEKLGK